MDLAQRKALIVRYSGGYDAVVSALAGITDDDLDIAPAPDAWSARMVIHHLADSETRSYIRLQQLLADPDPVIAGYDQAEYARRLHYDRPIAISLATFRAIRDQCQTLFSVMTEDDWQRSGQHSESGPYAVTTWLEIYAEHPWIHADQIRRARLGQV